MASKTETARLKAIADLLRQQLFIGVEATSAQENAAKSSSGGQQPRRERLLNIVNVMERDNSNSGGAAKPRLLCITVKRNRKLRLHKVKMGNNVAEISKTWTMDEVKSIEFKEPTRFSLQLNHKYDFTSTDAVLVEGFVLMLVKYCNKYAIKPPRYINTVSGAVASGGSGTARPRTAYGRNLQPSHAMGSQAPPPLPSFEPGKKPVDKMIAADSPVRTRTLARGHNRPPNDQTALMRRMTKYVADHGGDVSELVPMSAAQPEETLQNDARVPGEAEEEEEEEAEDIEEMLLDEAFMLSADELVSDFGWRANIDAAQLESRLLSELHKLESDNVRDMLEADKQVPRLVRELDQAIANLEEMEGMLKFYGIELESMDDDVRKIQMENENLKVEEANQQLLLAEMDKILKTITLSEEELQILRNESLETTDGIERVERVAASLKRMLGSNVGGGVAGLEAAHEKMKKYEFYSDNFSTRVFDYLKVMFQFKIDGCLNDKGRMVKRGVRLVNGPEQVHKMMIKYAGLTLWLKEAKPSADKDLQAIYLQCMNSLYASQIRELIESCRPFFSRSRHETQGPGGTAGGGGVGGGPTGSGHMSADYAFAAGSGGGAGGPTGRRISLDGLSGAAHQVMSSASKSGDPSGSGAMLGGGPTSSSDVQASEAFGVALENLISNVIAEQNFISDLFHYVPPAHIRSMHRITKENKGKRASEEMRLKIEENANFYSWVTHKIRPIEHWEMPRPKLDSKDVVSQTVHFGSVKEVKSMLDLLFGGLVAQVDALIDMGTRSDPSQAIGMLVSVSKALDLCEGSDQGFLINILERCCDKLESIFQRFINEQARSIEATKFVVKKRMGALPFARVFPKFIAHIERLVGDTGYSARAIADGAYSRISRLIFDTLESLLRDAERNAQKNIDDKDAQKEQLNTHVLLLENMFVLIGGLQAYKAKECKPYFALTLDSYLDHAQIVQRKVTRAYLKDVLQRPLGKLVVFFDAVERCLAANKDPMQTSNLSKSQLKKIIQAHSNSNMRENVKSLSKRVEKHFMNEPRLKPVVWQAIVDDVLSNYQRFVTLLARAYKSTNLSLDFTQNDLKLWLSER
ncbi:hypothetical protein GGI23_001503 [Coemansia sp. RSA 2559]|nr:hypothetical protein GGI23_001503 [Coemansia sp. RSA 2559]